ncbi:MAG: metallophosphoesterase [Bdellovibrionales bacterium]
MKRLLHISDLHFGRLHPPALDSLQFFIQQQDYPFDLVIVTGDWTQRARRRQFRAAREFLLDLRSPVLSVPGNHDVPLYDLWSRLLRPMHRYKHYIEPHGVNVFRDRDAVVVGISTVTRFAVQEGKVHSRELERAQAEFASAAPGATRILACHHGLPEEASLKLNADVILSGHTHSSAVELKCYQGRSAVLSVRSGTTVSARWREEVNCFHVLSVSGRDVAVETYDLGASGFVAREIQPTLYRLPIPHSVY